MASAKKFDSHTASTVVANAGRDELEEGEPSEVEEDIVFSDDSESYEEDFVAESTCVWLCFLVVLSAANKHSDITVQNPQIIRCTINFSKREPRGCCGLYW